MKICGGIGDAEIPYTGDAGMSGTGDPGADDYQNICSKQFGA